LRLFWPGNDPARPAELRFERESREAWPVRFSEAKLPLFGQLEWA